MSSRSSTRSAPLATSELDRGADLFAFEDVVTFEHHLRVELRVANEQQAEAQRNREGSGKDDELRKAGREGRQQSQRR